MESDLTWQELREIAKRLEWGEDYDKIKADFNIDGRGCEQLSTMMNQRFGCKILKCLNPV